MYKGNLPIGMVERRMKENIPIKYIEAVCVYVCVMCYHASRLNFFSCKPPSPQCLVPRPVALSWEAILCKGVVGM